MSWVEMLLNNYGKLKLASEAVMVEDRQKLLRDGRDSVKAWNQTILGDAMPAPKDTPAGDDMIHIGDAVTHQHFPPPKTGLGTLAKLGVGAALIATGAGAGLGVPLILDALRPKPAVATPDPPAPLLPPPTVKSQPTTLFDLDFGPEPK